MEILGPPVGLISVHRSVGYDGNTGRETWAGGTKRQRTIWMEEIQSCAPGSEKVSLRPPSAGDWGVWWLAQMRGWGLGQCYLVNRCWRLLEHRC